MSAARAIRPRVSRLGKRVHKPIIITKELDQSTPLLYGALANNETFTVSELGFWRASATGVEEHYSRSS